MSTEAWWIKGVSAVLITYGDVALEPILYSLPFEDIVVWNSKELTPMQRTMQMYGRYKAADQCKNDVVYVQDDDCIVDVRQLVHQFKIDSVTCNMPVAKREEYKMLAPGVSLVGWGAVFHKDCLNVFDKYIGGCPADDLFYREADRVFTYLNHVRNVDVPFRHLPHAHHKSRLGAQPEHLASLAKIHERLRAL